MANQNNDNISEAEKKKIAAEKKAEEKKIADAIALEEKEAAEKKAQLEKEKADKEAKESEVKTYRVKAKKDLGFEKRNFYIGNKNCLIEAGAEVEEDFYNQFNAHAKKIFFEN